MSLLIKRCCFNGPSTQHTFDLLKEVLISALVLLHVSPTKPFQIEIDGFDFAIGAILTQPNDDGHPASPHRETPLPHFNVRFTKDRAGPLRPWTKESERDHKLEDYLDILTERIGS